MGRPTLHDRPPLAVQQNRAKAGAYQAAYRRLRDVHRAEFDIYYADERRRAGLA